MTETLDIKSLIIEGIQNRKGKNITIVDLSSIDTAACSTFIIAEGTSTMHVGSVADSIEETVRKSSGVKPYGSDGNDRAEWIVLDYGDIFAHVFIPTERQRYNLEELWGDAKITNIPDLD